MAQAKRAIVALESEVRRISDDIKKYNALLKELKELKKSRETKILDIMNTHHIQHLDIGFDKRIQRVERTRRARKTKQEKMDDCGIILMEHGLDPSILDSVFEAMRGGEYTVNKVVTT